MKIVGCFLEYDGKFLMLLRHSHKPNGSTWGLPAGKVDPGETDRTAILRELKEETGYEASDNELEHLNDFEFGQGDSAYSFGAYRVKLSKPYDMKLEEAAHRESRWVTAQECYNLPNLISDFHELLELLRFVGKR